MKPPPKFVRFAHYGGLIGYIDGGTYEVSNCFATGSVTSFRYSSGFIGHMVDAANVTVTNGFTSSDLSGITHASQFGVFCGATDNATITCTGWIGRNSTSLPLTYGTSTISTTTNYHGQEGTISAKPQNSVGTPTSGILLVMFRC